MKKEIPPEQLAQVAETFSEMVGKHNLECDVLPDGKVVSKDGKIGFQFFVRSFKDEPDNKGVQLDFVTRFSTVKSGPGQIVESFAGFGSTFGDCVKEAFGNMVRASFHPIFSAVSGLPPCRCEENSLEVWLISGRPRQVFMGPYLTRGDFSQWDQAMFESFLNAVQDSISALPMSEEINWVRLFYSQQGDSPINEALWNNVPCPELTQMLKVFPWPRSSNGKQFGSIRFFLVVNKLGAVTVMNGT